MGIQQVPEQFWRAPVRALRAVYAEIGRIVLAADGSGSDGPELSAKPPETLPLPNYDVLSLASIRARLRGLDVSDLKTLLAYEVANAERTEVVGMLERRIDKLEAGG